MNESLLKDRLVFAWVWPTWPPIVPKISNVSMYDSMTYDQQCLLSSYREWLQRNWQIQGRHIALSWLWGMLILVLIVQNSWSQLEATKVIIWRWKDYFSLVGLGGWYYGFTMIFAFLFLRFPISSILVCNWAHLVMPSVTSDAKTQFTAKGVSQPWSLLFHDAVVLFDPFQSCRCGIAADVGWWLKSH